MAAGRRKEPPQYYPVSIDRNGTSIQGEYTVEAGMVTVRSVYGTKSTQQGNSPAETVAERLLFQLTASFDRPAE